MMKPCIIYLIYTFNVAFKQVLKNNGLISNKLGKRRGWVSNNIPTKEIYHAYFYLVV